MKISVFGTGYVGLVTGACLADSGHDVCCVDIDQSKIQALQDGQIPIYEPGLERLVVENQKHGGLSFSTDVQQGIEFGDILFIAVGTPPQADGSADLSYVLNLAADIGRFINCDKVVVSKSTVPVGTGDKIVAALEQTLTERELHTPPVARVVSNPEFLKEGAAVADFMKPDRIIIGSDDDIAIRQMREVYAPFNRNHDRIVIMNRRSSELTKYAANAMLATKISFINEIANIAEHVGADIEMVRQGIGSDPRIGYQFIYPGCGYGGSCFPKDVQALYQTAQAAGINARILASVDAVNQQQKTRLMQHILNHFNGDISGLTFALWGLAFKPNTDDMREAPSRYMMQALWEQGAKVQAFDPVAMEATQEIFGDRDDLILMGTKEAALQNADALIICTEWKGFMAPDFNKIKTRLSRGVIFDGRNIYLPETVKDYGLNYYAIGRGLSVKAQV